MLITNAKTVPEIVIEYLNGNNKSYRKLAELLDNNTGYPTHATIGNWLRGRQPDVIKLEVILDRVQTDEARELVRALLDAVTLEE